MSKAKPVTIKALDSAEVDRLLEDDVYSRFSPTKCNDCGRHKEFDRRIFHITGVKKNKYSDDETQNLLQYHFLHQHKIKHVFFRENAGKFYADSAVCKKCKSTAIVFDIKFDDAVMADYMKALGCEGGDMESARVKLEKLAAEF